MSSAALTVAVLEGGATGEREVSLATGQAVRAALGAGQHRVLRVELDADGTTWHTDDFTGPALACLSGPLADVDVFFLALHGGAGEGGALQGLFESLGRCYTGSGLAASALCLDKLSCLRVLAAEGLVAAPRLVFAAGANEPPLEAALELGRAAGGLVVKPRHGGSSVAVSVLAGAALDRERLEAALAAVFAVPDQALVEALVPGLEVTCAVLESQAGRPEALPVVEIHPKDGRFFDYEEKYSESGAREVCPPESLAAETIQAIEAAALLAHRATGAVGYSRSDFILPDRAPSSPVFLELNTLPGLTPRSLLPLAASRAGLDFAALCERIVHAARRA